MRPFTKLVILFLIFQQFLCGGHSSNQSLRLESPDRSESRNSGSDWSEAEEDFEEAKLFATPAKTSASKKGRFWSRSKKIDGIAQPTKSTLSRSILPVSDSTGRDMSSSIVIVDLQGENKKTHPETQPPIVKSSSSASEKAFPRTVSPSPESQRSASETPIATKPETKPEASVSKKAELIESQYGNRKSEAITVQSKNAALASKKAASVEKKQTSIAQPRLIKSGASSSKSSHNDYGQCQEPWNPFPVSGKTDTEKARACTENCRQFKGVLRADESAFCFTWQEKAMPIIPRESGVLCECGMLFKGDPVPARCNPSKTMPVTKTSDCSKACPHVYLLFYERKVIDCGNLFSKHRKLTTAPLKGAYPVKVPAPGNANKVQSLCECYLDKKQVKASAKPKIEEI